MQSTLFKSICRLLVVSMIFLSFQSAQAGMIGSEQVAAGAQADRAAVLNLLSRSEVSTQLQSMGLDPSVARERVAAMTDQEVHALAGKVSQLPAGAHITGWGWALIVIVIAAVIFGAFGWKR